jgi:hypothetical protein
VLLKLSDRIIIMRIMYHQSGRLYIYDVLSDTKCFMWNKIIFGKVSEKKGQTG